MTRWQKTGKTLMKDNIGTLCQNIVVTIAL